MKGMMRRVRAGLLFLAALGAASPPKVALPTDLLADAAAIKAATRAMCDKRVVLIGESYHGDGRTDAVRVALVERLITRCGFRAVLFEASTYEFIPIARAVRAGQPVTADMIATAVGGLWKFDEEVKPLFPFLAERINARQVTVGGLDHQIGGLEQPYSNKEVTAEVTEALPEAERFRCRSLLHARFDFEYPDDEHGGPITRQLQQLLLSCIAAATKALDAQKSLSPELRDERHHSLDNLTRYLAADNLPLADRIVERDRVMADNFSAFMSRQPSQTKVIVWTHNVHAARNASWEPHYQSSPNLGALITRDYRDRAFALGITARSGSYRQARKTIVPVPVPPPGALELPNSAKAGNSSTFLDAKALRRVGIAPAALDNHIYRIAEWADSFDGVLVLNQEHPPHSTRPGF